MDKDHRGRRHQARLVASSGHGSLRESRSNCDRIAARGLAGRAFDTSKLGQGGSLLLEDFMPLIGQSAQLKGEVDQALAAAKKKPEDVLCTGTRFPGQWENLAGARVSPYTCNIGGKWLRLRATVRITDDRGRAFRTITRAAMKNASNVSETAPKWKWTTEEPPDNR